MPYPEEIRFAKLRFTCMAVVAVVILTVLAYLMIGGAEWLRPTATIRTFVKDSAGLRRGFPVRLNGVGIGKIKSVRLSTAPDPLRVIEIELEIKERFVSSIPDDSTVTVSAENILGDQFVDIAKGKSPTPVKPGGELQSPPPKELDRANLFRSVEETLRRVDAAMVDIETGQNTLGKLVKGEEIYGRMMAQVQSLHARIRAVRDPRSPAGRLMHDEQYYNQLVEPIRRLDRQLVELQGGQGAGRFLTDSSQYDAVRKSIGELNQKLEDFAGEQGKGAKLLRDDQLYERLTRLVRELNEQVDALNAGEGALGRMLTTSQLYESLDSGLLELQNTVREFRANPRKYLFVKVF